MSSLIISSAISTFVGAVLGFFIASLMANNLISALRDEISELRKAKVIKKVVKAKRST